MKSILISLVAVLLLNTVQTSLLRRNLDLVGLTTAAIVRRPYNLDLDGLFANPTSAKKPSNLDLQVYSWDHPPTNLDLVGLTTAAIVKRRSNLDLYKMPQGNPNTSHNLDLTASPEKKSCI